MLTARRRYASLPDGWHFLPVRFPASGKRGLAALPEHKTKAKTRDALAERLLPGCLAGPSVGETGTLAVDSPQLGSQITLSDSTELAYTAVKNKATIGAWPRARRIIQNDLNIGREPMLRFASVCFGATGEHSGTSPHNGGYSKDSRPAFKDVVGDMLPTKGPNIAQSPTSLAADIKGLDEYLSLYRRCLRKESLTLAEAERISNRTGLRHYHCSICFDYHMTKKGSRHVRSH